MPTYVYECAKCGEEFELYQSFSDEPLKKHPECGGKVAKVFQPVGIVLKGSGFYKNDSRSSANGKRAKSTDAGTSDGGSSKPDKTDKTEKKAEPSATKSDASPSKKKSDSSSTSTATSS